MEVHEFFAKYANTPLKDRLTPISFYQAGDMSLDDVYKRMKQLEDIMLPMRIEQGKLIKFAEIVFNKKKK